MPRRMIPTLSLLGTMIMLPACGSPRAQQDVRPTPTTAGPQLELTMEVVQLQHISATQTAEIVSDLISSASGNEQKTYVIPDDRLNALIVYGSEVERKHIHDLLVELDKPTLR